MRWGVISDIHGNSAALLAVLDELRRFGVERYVCLGDLVGYGPHPAEVVRAVRELQPVIVAGNHDLAVVGGLALDWFAEVPRVCLQWTTAVLDAECLEYLSSLPRTAVLGEVRLVHALPPESATVYLTPAALERLVARSASWRERLCFVGHTHRPQHLVLPPSGSRMEARTDERRAGGGSRIERRVARWYGAERRAVGGSGARPSDQTSAARPELPILQPLLTAWRPPADGRRAVVNVGSVGQPRDGDPRAFCAVWDDVQGTLETRRVAYDVERVVADMAARGLPEEPAQRLRTGL